MNQFRKNILIVCEGKVSEPNYFEQIYDILIEQDVKIYIDVRPKSVVKEDKKAPKSKVRDGGRKRQIQNEDVIVPTIEIEEMYKAQPLSYVREAQLALEDETFDEVWAVFDKDGHPKHKEAFELAETEINGKRVNIAFTSIAFEYWLLLHFEENSTAFEKSMCRKNLSKGKKEHFYCGSKSHKDDCQGLNCVCGRLVNQSYLEYSGKNKNFLFSDYHPNVNSAIERAIMLRNSYSENENPIYSLNPFTNIDRLVFKLLQLYRKDYFWFNFCSKVLINNFLIQSEYDNMIIKISVQNINKTKEILNIESFCLVSLDGEMIECGKREKIDSDEIFCFKIDLSKIENFSPVYFGYRENDFKYYISEIPFSY
ncbi:RloB family protein [Flavobacterium sp.]|uniref:RloB family protein n=1 Tax=Flavobacterium sp. TaxID=239 RepID=UPI00286DC8B7|nr:RloB family protein [Flavobacterium sp.]